jgi:CDP-diacylglycerol--glycerol-3-phosphate 3-phosphatidyltransferase
MNPVAGHIVSSSLISLRRQWAAVAVAWLVVWLGFYASSRSLWPLGGRWLALSGVTLGYGLRVLWRNLPSNHRLDESELLPTIGPGNALSLVRGLCIGLLAGFLFGPWPPGAMAWIIVLLYTLVDAADYFDGYLARRANHVTILGGALDVEFDGLGTLVVVLLAVSFGQLPVWYLALGLARYLFVFGLWLRRRFGRSIREAPPSVHRRVFAGFQMGFLSAVLWPILPRSMAVIAGTLYAAATGLGFLRDWLVVVGRLDPTNPRYLHFQRALYRLLAVILPSVWRLVLLVSMASILRAIAPPLPPTAWRDLIDDWGIPAPALWAALVTAVAILGVLLVALGVLGRVLSTALVLPLGFDVITRGPNWANGLALVSVVFLQLFGPGPWALWPADERFILRRLGER